MYVNNHGVTGLKTISRPTLLYFIYYIHVQTHIFFFYNLHEIKEINRREKKIRVVFIIMISSISGVNFLVTFRDSSKCSLTCLTPLQAILFDIDGTLCDSDPLHYYVFREMLREVFLYNFMFTHIL